MDKKAFKQGFEDRMKQAEWDWNSINKDYIQPAWEGIKEYWKNPGSLGNEISNQWKNPSHRTLGTIAGMGLGYLGGGWKGMIAGGVGGNLVGHGYSKLQNQIGKSLKEKK